MRPRLGFPSARMEVSNALQSSALWSISLEVVMPEAWCWPPTLAAPTPVAVDHLWPEQERPRTCGQRCRDYLSPKQALA